MWICLSSRRAAGDLCPTSSMSGALTSMWTGLCPRRQRTASPTGIEARSNALGSPAISRFRNRVTAAVNGNVLTTVVYSPDGLRTQRSMSTAIGADWVNFSHERSNYDLRGKPVTHVNLGMKGTVVQNVQTIVSTIDAEGNVTLRLVDSKPVTLTYGGEAKILTEFHYGQQPTTLSYGWRREEGDLDFGRCSVHIPV